MSELTLTGAAGSDASVTLAGGSSVFVPTSTVALPPQIRVPVAAARPVTAGKSWADVTALALHYVACGVLLGGLSYLVIIGKVDAQVLVGLVAGAAGALGILNTNIGGK